MTNLKPRVNLILLKVLVGRRAVEMCSHFLSSRASFISQLPATAPTSASVISPSLTPSFLPLFSRDHGQYIGSIRMIWKSFSSQYLHIHFFSILNNICKNANTFGRWLFSLPTIMTLMLAEHWMIEYWMIEYLCKQILI